MAKARAYKPREMTDEAREQKNKKIAETFKSTKERRKHQRPVTRVLKVQRNKLSHAKIESIEMTLVEGKWIYNDALGSDDIFHYVPPRDEVEVKYPDGFQTRELNHIGSQIKQGIVQKQKNAIKGLAKKKENGKKVGALKFKSELTSIPLKQHGTTYEVDIKHNRVRVQGIGWMKVNGAKQLKGLELANAELIKCGKDYYIYVTGYEDEEVRNERLDEIMQPGTHVSMDFGLNPILNLSNGYAVDAYFGETERLKRLQQKLARQVKGSNGYKDTRDAINEEWRKIENMRDDSANKMFHELLKNQLIIMQDDNFAAWSRRKGYVRGGRKVNSSILGRLKEKIKTFGDEHPERVDVLDRFLPTTRWCILCGDRTPHAPGKEIFVCKNGDFSIARNFGSCMSMKLFAYLGAVGTLGDAGLDESIITSWVFSTARMNLGFLREVDCSRGDRWVSRSYCVVGAGDVFR